MTTIHRFTRRKLLGIAGVVLTLPLLEAMVPLNAQASDAGKHPRRMICINTSLGLHMPNLFPNQALL